MKERRFFWLQVLSLKDFQSWKFILAQPFKSTFAPPGTHTRSDSQLRHASNFRWWQRHCSSPIHLHRAGHGASEACLVSDWSVVWRDVAWRFSWLPNKWSCAHLRMITPWPLLFCFHPAVAYFIGLFRFQAGCFFASIFINFKADCSQIETQPRINVRCSATQNDSQRWRDPAKLAFVWFTIWTRGMASHPAAQYEFWFSLCMSFGFPFWTVETWSRVVKRCERKRAWNSWSFAWCSMLRSWANLALCALCYTCFPCFGCNGVNTW